MATRLDLDDGRTGRAECGGRRCRGAAEAARKAQSMVLALDNKTRAAPWRTTRSCCWLGTRHGASAAHSSGSPRPPPRCAPWAALSPSQSSAWSATPRRPSPSGSRASPPCSSSLMTPNTPIMACAPGYETKRAVLDHFGAGGDWRWGTERSSWTWQDIVVLVATM